MWMVYGWQEARRQEQDRVGWLTFALADLRHCLRQAILAGETSGRRQPKGRSRSRSQVKSRSLRGGGMAMMAISWRGGPRIRARHRRNLPRRGCGATCGIQPGDGDDNVALDQKVRIGSAHEGSSYGSSAASRARLSSGSSRIATLRRRSERWRLAVTVFSRLSAALASFSITAMSSVVPMRRLREARRRSCRRGAPNRGSPPCRL